MVLGVIDWPSCWSLFWLPDCQVARCFTLLQSYTGKRCSSHHAFTTTVDYVPLNCEPKQTFLLLRSVCPVVFIIVTRNIGVLPSLFNVWSFYHEKTLLDNIHRPQIILTCSRCITMRLNPISFIWLRVLHRGLHGAGLSLSLPFPLSGFSNNVTVALEMVLK